MTFFCKSLTTVRGEATKPPTEITNVWDIVPVHAFDILHPTSKMQQYELFIIVHLRGLSNIQIIQVMFIKFHSKKPYEGLLFKACTV